MSAFRKQVWNQTITVYHRRSSTGIDGKTSVYWEREVCADCFYGTAKKQRIDGMTLFSKDTTIARIPGEPETAVGKGDIIVGASVEDEILDGTGTAIRKKYAGNCFTVSVYKDNRKLKRSAHYYAAEE